MEFINLSGSYLNARLDKKGLQKLILLPDYSPSKDKLPVGSVAVYDKEEHIISSKYLGPDTGCGMLLAKFISDIEDLEDVTNGIASRLLEKPRGLGSLGHGNHFITFYDVADTEGSPLKNGEKVVLIHSGSRERGLKLYEQGLKGDFSLEMQGQVEDYAKKNREMLLNIIKDTGKIQAEPVFDRPHNFFEINDGKITYRKGAVKLVPGEFSVLSSSMAGDALIVKAKPAISELEYSLPHSTGRKISRKKAKEGKVFLDGFPKNIYVPYFIYAENLAGEMPACYKTVEEITPSIEKYVEITGKLKPKASIML